LINLVYIGLGLACYAGIIIFSLVSGYIANNRKKAAALQRQKEIDIE